MAVSDAEKDIQWLIEATKKNIIEKDDVQAIMDTLKRKTLMKQHPYKVWQLPDGRWRTYIPDASKKTKRRAITKTDLIDLQDAVIDYLLNAPPKNRSKSAITLKALYPEWLDYKSIHTRAKTSIMRINSDWKRYYLEDDIINRPITELSKLFLDSWLHEKIQEYDMTKNQYYNFSMILRQTLDYAVDAGYLEKNLLHDIKIDGRRLFKKVRKKPSETQVFTEEEFKKLRLLAWDDFNNHVKTYELSPLAVLFQFETGVRIGELCALRYEDCLEKEGMIHVQRMLRRDTGEIVDHTKNYGDRFVYLTSEAKRIIQSARQRQRELAVDSDGYIFSITSQPLKYRPVADLYEKYCNYIGTAHKSSHKARKTYISKLIDGRVNINTVRAMAGHSDERTTYNSYVFDRCTEAERYQMIENALKLDSKSNKVDSNL